MVIRLVIIYLFLDYLNEELEILRADYELSALSVLDPKNTDENINFWKETHENNPDKLTEIREQNAKAIKEMFLWANAAPSNLRYGDSSSNGALQENFDPMGDASGTITTKESEMIETYVINYETTEMDGQYYLRSSTGVYQPDISKRDHWYIKCLTNNEQCF